MCEANQTQVTQIYLLGFQSLYEFKPLFFVGVLLSYMIILFGNLLIISLVTAVDNLKIPMFIFLKHLATVDILMTTAVLPVMLNISLLQEGSVSLVGCFIQVYCYTIFGSMECFVIAVISYDRYLAICNPLHYAMHMNPHACRKLVIGTWLLSTVLTSSEIIVVCQLNFCSLNYVDYLFCDFGSIAELSTSEKYCFTIVDTITSLFTIPVPFVFIVITYIFISFNIMKLSSVNGRKKAFSTCSSHLAIVCTFYGTLIAVYIVPSDYSTVIIKKYRPLLCIVVPPMMNPIIYSLRNQEIKKVLLKLFNNMRCRRCVFLRINL